MEVISTKIHGVLDYMTAGLLIVLPLLLEMDSSVETLLIVAGVGLLGVSLLTHYELGVWKVISMKAHLVLDALLGLVLLGALLFLEPDTTGQVLLIVFGLLELGAALLTEREWSPGAEGPLSR